MIAGVHFTVLHYLIITCALIGLWRAVHNAKQTHTTLQASHSDYFSNMTIIISSHYKNKL